MIQKIGRKTLWLMIVLALVVIPMALFLNWRWWVLEIIFVPLVILGFYDITQRKHSITRNFPIIGHFRFIIEDMGPELHQYLVESDTDGRPFNRDTRSIIYERAKAVNDKKPFGTELNVYAEGYTFLKHSISTRPMMERASENMRVTVGGPQCTKPYDLSVLNISAMSFGALGGPAVKAMNEGAAKGGFAHDTGEGGLSKYHRNGGDLIWQIGTGYFGCRNPDGTFSPEAYAKTSQLPEVKMIEIKVSQGAKPGHGGILPAPKVTEEIAEARLVPAHETVYSPTYHQSFSTPLEMMDFITQLRELSGGKPVGFKICIGEPREFMSIVHAMKQTGVMPDFIVVDGGEGGTGAAPQEFSDSMGFPLAEGLAFVHNTLVGVGLRPFIKIGASGKMVTASAMAFAMSLGADWCNSARAFMFAVGCIQSQRCHTNKCPVGVATQDPKLQRALDVPLKSERVYQFHKNTVDAFAEMIAAMGLDHPRELAPHHVERRINATQVASLDEIYPFVLPNGILEGTAPPRFVKYWAESSADTFKYESGVAAYR